MFRVDFWKFIWNLIKVNTFEIVEFDIRLLATLFKATMAFWYRVVVNDLVTYFIPFPLILYMIRLTTPLYQIILFLPLSFKTTYQPKWHW